MAKFVRLNDEQARGELLDRCAAEQQYWLRKGQRGRSAADADGEREFYRIMHAYLDLGAAVGDARRMVEGQAGAGRVLGLPPDRRHRPRRRDAGGRPVSETTQARTTSPARQRKPKPAPADLGPIQVLRHTDLAEWQWVAARAAGLIPPPDVEGGGRWSIAVADEVAARRAQIVAAVGTKTPIGGHKAAERLAARTGLEVEKFDMEALVEAGALRVHGWYKQWPLYACPDLDQIGADQLAPIVAERQAWRGASVHASRAAEHLGWRREEFERVRTERGLVLGRHARYAKTDLDALAADEELAERLLIASQAAEHLEVRPTDFGYLVAADLAVPHRYTTVEVTRYRTVAVPLYRVADLEALREHPGIDWEAVHAVKPGEPSPLRELARRPVDRAAVIRRWVAELGDRHGIEVWAWWNNAAGQWEIDFERVDGAPTVAQVRAAIAGHPYLARYREDIAVATHAGAAIRWARAMRKPATAVILDTETTDLDGYVVEIAVIDAATGDTLLDTLVNPGCAIQPGAYWVHGISDADVADAPPWSQVLPDLLRVTEGRTVLAYNAEFDAGVVAGHSHRDGLDLGHLAEVDRWACLMGRRSDWELRWRWLPLGGGHRALGDCQTAYQLLCAMTAPAHQPKAARR